MLCSKTTDPSRCLGMGMMEERKNPLDDGLGEFDEGLRTKDEGTNHELWNKTYRCPFEGSEMLDREAQKNVMKLYGPNLSATIRRGVNDLSRLLICSFVLPKRFILRDICETNFYWTMGGQKLRFPLDVEWTLLEEWGYKAPVLHEDFEKEVDAWDMLHVSEDDLEVRDRIFGNGYTAEFNPIGDKVEAVRKRILDKEKTLKIVWPSLIDRLLYREGHSSLPIVYSITGFGVDGSLFSSLDFSNESLLLTNFHHLYIFGGSLRDSLIHTDFAKDPGVKEDGSFHFKLDGPQMGRNVILSQTLSTEAFGPSISVRAFFNHQAFMVRVCLSGFDDGIAHEEDFIPSLVSFCLVLDEDNKMYFDLEKSLQPAWLETLGLECRGLYYFYMDPDFDGNLESLWSGEAKTYNFSRFEDPRFEIEVDTDSEVSCAITIVTLNHIRQEGSLQALNYIM